MLEPLFCPSLHFKILTSDKLIPLLEHPFFVSPAFLPLSLIFPSLEHSLPCQTGLPHLLQGLARVQDEGQSYGSGAVTALPGETEEGGPEEGAAAHEGCSHVQRHQNKVQKLKKIQS